MNKKGFTLMELLIVVVIIAGFAALTYPSYRSSIERARASEAVNMLGTIQAAQQKHFVNYEEYGTKFSDINDFEPGIKNFNPNATSFDTEYFRYDISRVEGMRPLASADRINSHGETLAVGYRLVAMYKEDFIRCVILNNSEEGIKVCSSLTDRERDSNYYPIY